MSANTRMRQLVFKIGYCFLHRPLIKTLVPISWNVLFIKFKIYSRWILECGPSILGIRQTVSCQDLARKLICPIGFGEITTQISSYFSARAWMRYSVWNSVAFNRWSRLGFSLFLSTYISYSSYIRRHGFNYMLATQDIYAPEVT